ncbi:MAG TPA: hypothetical protein VJH75_03840 [Patescibacteria group bacterium]|nr:hypothetical protein [Patescibacteria group bacterium]
MTNKERQAKPPIEVESKPETRPTLQKDKSSVGEVGARRTLKDFLVQSLGIKDERRDSDDETTELPPREEATLETPMLSLLENYRGAQPEHLNEYMEDRARKLGTTVDQLSAKQYEEVLKDDKGFKEWMAEKLVSNFIASRKALISTGLKVPDSHLGQRLRSAKREHPTSRELSNKEVQLHGRSIPEVEQLRTDLDAMSTLRQENLGTVVDTYESTIKKLRGMNAGEAAVAPLEQALAEARANLAREALQAREQGKKALEVAMARHHAELEELKQRQPFEVEGGIKREMSLSVRRWGEVLKDVIKHEDERDVFVDGDEIKLDQVDHWGNLDHTLQARLSDFFDREIDMMSGAKNPAASDNKVRKLNLDAIIQTDSEARLASFYLQGLGDRLRDSVRKQGESSESALLLKRYESLRQFLLNSQCTKGDDQGAELVTINILADWGEMSGVIDKIRGGSGTVETTFNALQNLRRLIEKRGSKSLFLRRAGLDFFQNETILRSCSPTEIVMILKSAGKASAADTNTSELVFRLAKEVNYVIGKRDSGINEDQRRSIRKTEYQLSRDNKVLDCPVDERTVIADFCNYSEEWDREWNLILDELKKRVDSQPVYNRKAEKQRLVETITAKLAFSPWTGEVAKDPRAVLRWEKTKIEKLQALVEWANQKT